MPAAVVIYKSTGTVVARMCGLSPEMDVAAHKVMAAAEALAAVHVKTGSYMGSFGVDRIKGKRGVIDREVFNDDDGAAAIEDGYLSISKTDTGRITVRFVEGQHILRNAARASGAL